MHAKGLVVASHQAALSGGGRPHWRRAVSLGRSGNRVAARRARSRHSTRARPSVWSPSRPRFRGRVAGSALGRWRSTREPTLTDDAACPRELFSSVHGALRYHASGRRRASRVAVAASALPSPVMKGTLARSYEGMHLKQRLRWPLAVGLVALLAGCASAPPPKAGAGGPSRRQAVERRRPRKSRDHHLQLELRPRARAAPARARQRSRRARVRGRFGAHPARNRAPARARRAGRPRGARAELPLRPVDAREAAREVRRQAGQGRPLQRAARHGRDQARGRARGRERTRAAHRRRSRDGLSGALRVSGAAAQLGLEADLGVAARERRRAATRGGELPHGEPVLRVRTTCSCSMRADTTGDLTGWVTLTNGTAPRTRTPSSSSWPATCSGCSRRRRSRPTRATSPCPSGPRRRRSSKSRSSSITFTRCNVRRTCSTGRRSR